MRWATPVVTLAWIITSGCTGSAATDDTQAESPTGTADALVQLPPAPVLTAPRPGLQALGEWNWRAPCRVGAREVVGSRFPRVARTFTIDIVEAAVGDGLVLSFDDVAEVTDGLTEEQVADALYRNLAVLPAMELDSAGRFVDYRNLDADLTALLRRAGVVSPAESAVILARQPVVAATILDRTMLGWYGHWLEHDALPINPDRLAGERQRSGPSGPWSWSTETYAAPVVGERGARTRDGGVWLIHTERRVDSGTARLDASAIVDPSDRRPSYVVVSIDGFTAGGLTAFAEQDRRVVKFDWENAEGCE